MNWVTPKGIVELYEEEEALLADLVARMDVEMSAANAGYNPSPIVGLYLLEPCS